MIVTVQILFNIIHLISSFIWWNLMLVVILIIRPLNKNGNLSILLPKIQKIVFYSSITSLISGFILFGVNTNFQYYKLFSTIWGNIIAISGILSLSVFYNIVSGGTLRTILIKINAPKKLYNKIPLIMFSLITLTLILMILLSNIFFGV